MTGMRTKVTAWSKVQEKEGIIHIEHNHLEDGWVEAKVPSVKVRGSAQEKWKLSKWKKTYGYLENNKFIKAQSL